MTPQRARSQTAEAHVFGTSTVRDETQTSRVIRCKVRATFDTIFLSFLVFLSCLSEYFNYNLFDLGISRRTSLFFLFFASLFLFLFFSFGFFSPSLFSPSFVLVFGPHSDPPGPPFFFLDLKVVRLDAMPLLYTTPPLCTVDIARARTGSQTLKLKINCQM